MAKQRDRPAKGVLPLVRHCLPPRDLFEFEKESILQIAKLPAWPKPLALWRDELVEAQRQAKANGTLVAHVSFSARDPRAKNSDAPHSIELGVQILPSGAPLVTYFFAIGRKDSAVARTGLRKVHFDVDCTGSASEPKPSVHLQVAGRLPPPLAKVGYSESSFDLLLPSLDKPRVPCLPQSFALLAHLALLEYHRTDLGLEKFIKSPGWVSIVTRAESSVLKPYFEYGGDWLSSSSNSKQSLLSDYYGLSAP